MATFQLRLDDTLKQKADSLFSSLGLDTSTAIRIFLSAAVENNGIPFQVRHNDNFSLQQAILDSRNRKNLHGPFKTAQDAVNSMLDDWVLYNIVYTNRMKKDAKLMQKRGKDMSKLVMVLDLLASGIELPKKYKDHQLTGNLHDFRECHIEPDWLLMYQIFENELILSATATGTHSDLFG